MGVLDNTKFILKVCELFYLKGMSQKEIASLLGTSIRTIRRIQNKLLIKTGLDNIKQLGLYSVAENWMSLDE